MPLSAVEVDDHPVWSDVRVPHPTVRPGHVEAQREGVRVGDLVILRSSVNRVFRSSMEVGVKVWVENYLVDSCEHVSSAHLTYVAVDRAGNKVPVPAVVPETEEERRRYDDAGRRRDLRRTERERRQKIMR